MIKISRRYISILLAAAMAFFALPMSGFAVYAEEEQEQTDISLYEGLNAAPIDDPIEEAVAIVEKKGADPIYVTSLENVFAAENSGATVTLLQNVDLGTSSLTVPEGVTLTLDCGEYTLTSSGSYTIYVDGNFCFKGGTLLNTNRLGLTVRNYGSFTMSGGVVNGENSSGIVHTMSGNSNITITGGIVGVDGGGLSVSMGTVTLYGGTYSSISISKKIGETLADILTEGYALQGTDGLIRRDTEITTAGSYGSTVAKKLSNVAVVECPHTGADVTANNDGTHSLNCQYCGYTEAAEACTYGSEYIIDETNHTQTCTACGGTKTEEHTSTVAATCKDKAVCDTCGKAYGEFAGHTLEKTEAADPTCTEDGNSEYWTCSVCEKIFSDENGTAEIDKIPTIPALEHDFGEWKTTVEPTCKETGTRERTCKREGCGYTETDDIEKSSAHTETEIPEVPPTCTGTGLTAGVKCSVCGTVLTAPTLVPAAGHSLDNGVETTPASCTEKGVKTFSCTKCDYTTTEEIAALGHNYVGGKCSVCQEVDPNHVCTGGAATCTQRAVCTICGKAYGNFAEHNYADGFCTVCNDPQPNHTHTGGTATCTQRAVCEICSNEYGNFGEHSFTNYIPNNNAACTADGTKTATCDNCTETKTVTDVGSATGHSFTNYVSDSNATCTADGTKTAVCDKCGVNDTITDEGSKLGHNFVDGECTRCHSADPNYTPTVTEPTETEPTVTEPTVTEPTVTEPTVTVPPVTEPTVTEPPVTYPNIPSGTSPSYQTTAVNQSTNTSQKMIDTINFTADGGTAEITLNGATKVDKTVFEAMQGRDITVVFKLSGGAYWTINGRDITKAKTVDLGVRLNKNAIPASKIKELAGDKKNVQFTLKHSGDFGFTGILNVPFGKAYNGKFANLYYYSKGEFEFVSVSEISGGNGAFVFTHASDYVAVIDDYSYIEDVSSAAGATDSGSPIDAASPVTNGVRIPQADIPRGFRISNKKRRYRILKKL